MNRFKAKRAGAKRRLSTYTIPVRQSQGMTPAGLLVALKELQQAMPTIFYIASEQVPNNEYAYKLPHSLAPVGYDLAFHPSLLEKIDAQMTGKCILRPLDAQEQRRRFMLQQKEVVRD